MDFKLTETHIKRAIGDYLQIKTNQGYIYGDRLNSGEVIVIAGSGRRRIKLCREGTADFFFIQESIFTVRGRQVSCCRLVFIEVKGPGGSQRAGQADFAGLVKKQGAEYHIVKDAQQVINLVEGRGKR